MLTLARDLIPVLGGRCLVTLTQLVYVVPGDELLLLGAIAVLMRAWMGVWLQLCGPTYGGAACL